MPAQPMRTQPNPLFEIQSNIEGIAWPPVLAGAGASLLATLQYLEESQWLPYAQVVQRQYKQLGNLAEHAAQYSPHFKQRLAQAGLSPQDIASPEGLRRLPLLTRREVQKAGQSFYCTQVPQGHAPCKEIKTSGSTGEPVNVIKTAVSILFLHANAMREHFWYKRDFMARALLIQSDDNVNYLTQKGWGHPVSLLFPSGEIRSLPITTDVRQQIAEIVAFKPEHLLVYPANLDAIVTLCQKEGIAIEGIKHVWSCTATLSPELRKRATDFLGAKIEDNYSSGEVGAMALECPHSGLYHIMSESIILEVLDEEGRPCAPGQTGKVVVTDLHNFATPLIRYMVGDYAEMAEACACGRGLPTLKSIAGRERNMLVKPGGVRHWPRIAMKHFIDIQYINQYQFIQHSLEEIEVRLVVTNSRLTPAQEANLTDYLQNNFGNPFRIRYSYFDDKLPLSARGKFEEFISLVA